MDIEGWITKKVFDYWAPRMDLTRSSGVCDLSKGKVLRSALVLFAPLFEEPAIAERAVVCQAHAEARGSLVDPIGRALQFCIIADGGFVNYAMSFAVFPLGAPLLIAERGYQTERDK